MNEPVDRPGAATADWTLLQRLSFRLLFLYLFLYFFPLPSGLADPDFLSEALDPLWHRLVPWAALHLFQVKITTFSNGSGDTIYDYFRILLFAAISLVGAAIWSIADRHRRNYYTLHRWAHLWLRYAVAASMIGYGLAKLFKFQFYDPSYNVLTTPVGDMSPQRLLWTFIGVSASYTRFAGVGEFVGGILLLFRRTALPGALILIGVMSNVVALNLCYDVCVKLGSMHLLLACLVLALPDAHRLLQFFVLNRATAPDASGPLLPQPWMRKLALVFQLLLIAAFLTTQVHSMLVRSRPAATYTVKSFAQGSAELPAADAHRWKTFQVSPRFIRIQEGDTTNYFAMKGDPKEGPITLLETDDDGNPSSDKPPVGELRIHLEHADQVTVDGTFKGQSVHAALVLPDASKLRLIRTGTNWVHEQPDSEPR